MTTPSTPTNALVTVTFWKDFERFKMQAESMDRWVPQDVPHYVFVDGPDLPLFRPFDSGRRKVLVVEDLLPRWMIKLPWKSPFWLSLRSGPVKNWILQQVVKLSIPQVVPEDVQYHLDSDVFFTGAFDPASLVVDGRSPLYVHAGNRGLLPEQIPWHDAAARLLGLPELHDDDRNYVRNIIPWDRRDALAALHRVSEVTGKPWQQAVSKLWHFSEYTLYGVYAERVLADETRLRPFDDVLVNEYWKTDPLDEAGIREFRAAATPEQIAVLIQSKSKTPVELIRKVYADRI